MKGIHFCLLLLTLQVRFQRGVKASADISPGTASDNTSTNRCPGDVVLMDATAVPQTIQSPNYPSPYPNDEDCRVKITAPRGVINITVVHSDIEVTRACLYDRLSIHDGPSTGSPCTAVLCGVVTSPESYITSSNEAYIHFHTDNSNAKSGFILTFQYVDDTIAPTIPCRPGVPSMPVTGRCVSGTVHLDATSTPQYIQSADYPTPPETDQDCKWKISAPQGVVKITVLHSSIEPGESCVYDSLKIYDGDSSESVCEVTLCGESSSVEEYITSSSEAFLHFHTDSSITHNGFILTYEYVDGSVAPTIPCPGPVPIGSIVGNSCPRLSVLLVDATSTPQTIESPNYPDNYDFNENCRWNISAPQGVIKITVLSFNIESEEDCWYDKLSIYDGISSEAACHVTLCGTDDESYEFITSSSEAFIQFTSDYSENHGGFNLTYQYVDGSVAPNIPCTPSDQVISE